MTTPLVPVSWGELLDKIAILEIKAERIAAPRALANVRRELDALKRAAEPVAGHGPELDGLRVQLKRVNESLWHIEDEIREKEARQSFDAQFVELARAVYTTNDERGRLKRRINVLLGSDLLEEKQYAPYPRS